MVFRSGLQFRAATVGVTNQDDENAARIDELCGLHAALVDFMEMTLTLPTVHVRVEEVAATRTGDRCSRLAVG